MKEIFEGEFICSDSSIAIKGLFKVLISTAIEFKDYSTFKDIYQKEIIRCNDKYGLNTFKKVIKSDDIKKRTPSYNVHKYIDDLVESTLKKGKKSINHVFVTNTHTKKRIQIPWQKSKAWTGVTFIDTVLSQYYPIVPIWRYYYNKKDTVENVLIDGISGKITKAWKFIGENAKNIYIVPHGDQTHYCISFCDILCTYINLNLRDIKYEDIKKLLEKNLKETKISTEYISDRWLTNIVPQYPHSIKPSTHYLHPLFLLYSNKKKEIKQIISESEVFDSAHRLAEENGGSAFYCDLKDDINVLQNGDSIICLDDNSYSSIEEIMAYNPSKKINIYDLKSFITTAKSLLAE